MSDDETSGNGGKRAEAAVNRLLWWILGATLTLLIAGGTGWVSYVAAQLDKIEKRDSSQDDTLAGVKERLGRVETTLGHVERDTQETRKDASEIRRLLEAAMMRQQEQQQQRR